MSTNFPTSLDTYSTKVDGTDYPQAAHINNPQDAILALEAKVGVDNSAVTTSLDYLLKSLVGGHRHDGTTSRRVLVTDLGLSTLTANQYVRVNAAGTAFEGSTISIPSGSLVGTTEVQTLTQKTLTQPTITLKQGASVTPTAEGDIQWDTDDNRLVVGNGTDQTTFWDKNSLFDLFYPVGTIYTNATNSTNPGTLLGRGTWTAFGAGRVMVGRNAADTDFDTAEETGGSKTTTVSHTHDFAHVHAVSQLDLHNADYVGGSFGYQAGSTATPKTFNTGAASVSTTGAMSANSTPSIVQPYIVVYLWKRTA